MRDFSDRIRRTNMNRSVFWAIFLLASIVTSTHAQLRNAAVDETRLLKSAQKVAVFINLGPPEAAPYTPDFDRARKQIAAKLAKQKLQMVADPVDADIVLVAREFNDSRGAIATGTVSGQTTTAIAQNYVCLGDEIKVFKGGKMPTETDAPIWSASDTCGFSWPLNRLMDKFAKASKK